jgi:hypothetical protein
MTLNPSAEGDIREVSIVFYNKLVANQFYFLFKTSAISLAK